VPEAVVDAEDGHDEHYDKRGPDDGSAPLPNSIGRHTI
jgi:hypothetical protein